MPMIYSDVEVHAKIVMDPDTLMKAREELRRLDTRDFPALFQVQCEMDQVISRLQQMNIL